MKKNLFYLVLFFISFSCAKNEDLLIPESSNITDNAQNLKSTEQTLILESQKKIYKLLPSYDKNDEFEASGVSVVGDEYYVVFDNRYKIATIKNHLYSNDDDHKLIGKKGDNSEFEAITYEDYKTEHSYVSVESEKKDGDYYPYIRKYDNDLDYQEKKRVNYKLPGSQNKGMEGLARVRKDDDEFLLGLFEGTGHIIVLTEKSSKWSVVKDIDLQQEASFIFSDYSDIAIDKNGRVAITSQEESKLWIGQLDITTWSIAGSGTIYSFPKGDDDGVIGAGNELIYANIEGVSFIDDTRIVVCSDKAKSSQHDRTRVWDQSVHVFSIPQ